MLIVEIYKRIIVPNVVMLSVVMLIKFIMNYVIPGVIMLNVVM